MTTAYLLFVGEPVPAFSPVLKRLKDAGCNEAFFTIKL
jgi:hypothetical protein